MTRGKSRQTATPGIPPMRCTATAKSTGQRCRRWALVGQTVCDLHGGKNPAGERARDRRLAVAQLLQWEDPDSPRPLGEVMLEAVHNADVLQRSSGTPACGSPAASRSPGRTWTGWSA